MRETVQRVALVLLLVQLVVGAWAAFTPRSFYDDFPGGGLAWVSVDGPYNEHLVRDVGGLSLALGVVTLVAAITLVKSTVVAAALAWLVYGVPHLVYHLRHLDVYDTSDQIAVAVSLSVAPVLALVALVAALRPDADVAATSAEARQAGAGVR
jgi:hypothetical protein